MSPREILANDLRVMMEVSGVSKMPDVGYMADLLLAAFEAGAYRDRALTATGPGSGAGQFRVGRSVGRTIYDSRNNLVGMMDTPLLASMFVAAINATPSMAAPQTDHRAAPADDYCACGSNDCVSLRGVCVTCHKPVDPPDRATPPSGSPPAVTEPTPGVLILGDGVKLVGDLPSARLVLGPAPAAAPGGPVTSGSPPGAVERAPCPTCRKQPVTKSSNGVDFYANCETYFCDHASGHGDTPEAALAHWDRLYASPPESPDGSRGTR